MSKREVANSQEYLNFCQRESNAGLIRADGTGTNSINHSKLVHSLTSHHTLDNEECGRGDCGSSVSIDCVVAEAHGICLLRDRVQSTYA